MIYLEEYLKTANLHAERMNLARDKLAHIQPFSLEKIGKLLVEELAYLELYTSRFSKLQDLLGAKIFPGLLEANGEQIDKLFYIDRLNLMEKLGVIDSCDHWIEIRKVRNQFAHEYPNEPELLAENLNKAFVMGPELISYLERAIEVAERVIPKLGVK